MSVQLCQPHPVNTSDRGAVDSAVLNTTTSSAYHLYCHWPSGCRATVLNAGNSHSSRPPWRNLLCTSLGPPAPWCSFAADPSRFTEFFNYSPMDVFCISLSFFSHTFILKLFCLPGLPTACCQITEMKIQQWIYPLIKSARKTDSPDSENVLLTTAAFDFHSNLRQIKQVSGFVNVYFKSQGERLIVHEVAQHVSNIYHV